MIYLIDAKNVVLDCYPAVSNHDNFDFIKQVLFGQINGTSEIPQQSQIKSSYIERIGLIMYIRWIGDEFVFVPQDSLYRILSLLFQ